MEQPNIHNFQNQPQQSFTNNPFAPPSYQGLAQRVPTDRSVGDPNQYIESRVQQPYGYNYVESKNYQNLQQAPQYQAADSFHDPIQ